MAQQIKNILETLLTNDSTSWQIKLISQWSTIMGNLGTVAQLEKIEHDTITLSVPDSCWMQELHLMSPLLLATINQKLDQPRIKHLRFKKSGIKRTKKKEPLHRVMPAHLVTLNKTEEQALTTITDPELQEALRKFLVRCYQEK